jgi:hypothetical protein
LYLQQLCDIINVVFAEPTLDTYTPDELRRITPMAKLYEVDRVTTPTKFDELLPGTYPLRAPFFDSAEAEGGALQVGLEPDEFTDDDKREVIATIRERAGRRAIELARADGKPFTIESSLDDDESRINALGRAVTRLIIEDSLRAWMNIEADGEELLYAQGPEGLNRLVQNLTVFSLIKQKAAAEAAAKTAENS